MHEDIQHTLNLTMEEEYYANLSNITGSNFVISNTSSPRRVLGEPGSQLTAVLLLLLGDTAGEGRHDNRDWQLVQKIALQWRN